MAKKTAAKAKKVTKAKKVEKATDQMPIPKPARLKNAAKGVRVVLYFASNNLDAYEKAKSKSVEKDCSFAQYVVDCIRKAR